MERKKKRMTIKDLSEKTGISKSYISQIERNERRPFAIIEQILEALDLTMEDCKAAGVDWWSAELEPAPFVESSSDFASRKNDLEFLIDFFEKDPDLLTRLVKVLRSISGGDEK